MCVDHTCMYNIISVPPLSLSTQVEGGPPDTGPEFDNCKVLHDTLQLSWRVETNDSLVRFRLCGCTAADPKYNNIANYLCLYA